MEQQCIDVAYLRNLKQLIETGTQSDNRTAVKTRKLTAMMLSHDLQHSFPAITHRRLYLKGVWAELLWFLRGNTHNQSLRDMNCTIWDEWATEEKCKKFNRREGDLGPIYGFQWRYSGCEYVGCPEHNQDKYPATHPDRFDQIANLVYGLLTDPNSRRLRVDAWNPKQAEKVELPPCHAAFQLTNQPSTGKRIALNLTLDQRSADYVLGMPFNIASYATLVHILAALADADVGSVNILSVDAHVYANHVSEATGLIKGWGWKSPCNVAHTKPKLHLSTNAWKLLADARRQLLSVIHTESGSKTHKLHLITLVLDDLFLKLSVDDFSVSGYEPGPSIKFSVAV